MVSDIELSVGRNIWGVIKGIKCGQVCGMVWNLQKLWREIADLVRYATSSWGKGKLQINVAAIWWDKIINKIYKKYHM